MLLLAELHRFDDFQQSRWEQLWQRAQTASAKLSRASTQKRRNIVEGARLPKSMYNRGKSRARQKLIGAPLAARNEDKSRRPQEQLSAPRTPRVQPPREMTLGRSSLNVCEARRPNVLQDPGACSNELLKVCLDDQEALQLLQVAAEDFAKASVPESVFKAFIVARMTWRKHWLVSLALQWKQLVRHSNLPSREPGCREWRGSGCMTARLVCGTKRESVPNDDVWNPQGVKILGTQVGSADFVAKLATERWQKVKNCGKQWLGSPCHQSPPREPPAPVPLEELRYCVSLSTRTLQSTASCAPRWMDSPEAKTSMALIIRADLDIHVSKLDVHSDRRSSFTAHSGQCPFRWHCS